jgi:hypothetical protein
MRILDQNFEGVKELDHAIAKDLAQYFDFDFVTKNINDYQLWFNNLKKIAFQNLGLAHSVLHNQTAHNCVEIAFNETALPEFDRSYSQNIAGHSFLTLSSKSKHDSIKFDGKQLSGTKYWISNAKAADFVVMACLNSISKVKKIHYIFIDLKLVEHKITGDEYQPLGMNVATPFNLELDIDVPEHWIITNDHNRDDFYLASYFHNYGLICNYISCAKKLLALCRSQNYDVGYELDKLELNLKISETLFEQSIEKLFDKNTKTKFYFFNNQYQFARKNLIDVTKFFIELGSSSLLDSKSPASQVVRDSLMMTSHLVNLYNHMNNAITRFF